MITTTTKDIRIRLATRWSLGLTTLILIVGLPANALGTPPAYFTLPGTTANMINGLTVGADGTLWVLQTVSEGPNSSEDYVRVLHVNTEGQVISTSGQQPGYIYGNELIPASDAGAWLSVPAADNLIHFTSAGSEETIHLPKGEEQNLTAGKDGRAWLQLCNPEFSSGYKEEDCEAIAASPNGEIQSYDLSGMETPPYEIKMNSASSGAFDSIATAGGIWFWKDFSINEQPSTTTAEFLSYSGSGVSVAFPPNAFPAAPGDGDTIWWLENEVQGEVAVGAKLGELSPTGVRTGEHHIAGVSQWHDAFVADPGRNNNLVWAQNGTWNDTLDGQIGIARTDGSNTVYPVPKYATAVLVDPSANFWSGSCTFGVKLYEAVDGALWTISGGHPNRVTRQSPSGAFETFLILGASPPQGEHETGVWGLVETSPRELWLTLNTPTGPELARVDPLNPPPAEPKWPTDGQTTKRRSTSRHQAILRLLRSLIQQSHRKLMHPNRNGALRLHGRFPVSGTAVVTVKRRSGRRIHVLATGAQHGSSGPHQILLDVRQSLRRILLNPQGTKVMVAANFYPARGVKVRLAKTFHLAG